MYEEPQSYRTRGVRDTRALVGRAEYRWPNPVPVTPSLHHPTRFIFVEGLMGAGKTTLVVRIVRALREAGISAVPLWEGPTTEEPHQPLRLSPTLPHPYSPWKDLTADQYVAESLLRWRRFIAARSPDDTVVVCDGLLFHGNMTDLMLMDAPVPTLESYVLDVVSALQPLGPVAVHLRRPSVEEALRAVCEERGAAWRDYQVGWKVDSPYGQSRELAGFSGLVALYDDHRAVCDSLFSALPMPTLLVDSTGDWHAADRAVSTFLGIPIPNAPPRAASRTIP